MALPITGAVLGGIGLSPLTIKLIGFWTTFIGDVRRFGSDSQRLGQKFEKLSLRYVSIQKVLFDDQKFTFVSGKLYDDLPHERQQLVLGLLKELPRLLYKYYLIENSHRIHSRSDDLAFFQNHTLSAAAILTPEEHALLFAHDDWIPEGSEPSTLFSMRNILWAARTKKRVERLVGDYEGWLREIQEAIEDSWWPLSFFDKYVNVKALEEDGDCRGAGFATSAGTRKLLLSDAVFENNRIPDQIEDLRAFDKFPRGVARYKGYHVLVEELLYEPDKDGFLDTVLERRFKQVTALMKQQKDDEFRVLSCEGYDQLALSPPRFQLMSRIPEQANPVPKTLLELIDPKASEKPSLGERFQLCYYLSQSMSLFHSVGWRHRAFRSANILYFSSASEVGSLGASENSGPFICGFEASRLQSEHSTGPYDNNILLNVYRHPDRWGIPKKEFSKSHDIYALGVVMLEIGLWEKAISVGGNDFEKLGTEPHGISTGHEKKVCRALHHQAERRLGHRCGNRFRDLVCRCLTGNFEVVKDDALETKLQEGFRKLIVSELEELASSV